MNNKAKYENVPPMTAYTINHFKTLTRGLINNCGGDIDHTKLKLS